MGSVGGPSLAEIQRLFYHYPMRLLALPVSLVVLYFSGCYLDWEYVDDCGQDGVCLECKSDDDCSSGYSCCGETWFCFHRQEDTAPVCQLACTHPDPDPCGCVEGQCRFH